MTKLVINVSLQAKAGQEAAVAAALEKAARASREEPGVETYIGVHCSELVYQVPSPDHRRSVRVRRRPCRVSSVRGLQGCRCRCPAWETGAHCRSRRRSQDALEGGLAGLGVEMAKLLIEE